MPKSCDLGVPLCRGAFKFTDTTRVHLTMTWVVSFSIFRPFGELMIYERNAGTVRINDDHLRAGRFASGTAYE